MNEPIYICRQCGNTEVFTELVWEQRRYRIDGHGEAIGVSEPVEDTEVPVQVSCDNCGAVLQQLEFSCFRDSTYLTNSHSQPRKEG